MTQAGCAVADAMLVERIAALGDKAAMAELYARHRLTLYAVAYSVSFDPEVADAAVRAAFREVWFSAASLSASAASVQGWLTDVTRRAVRDQLRQPAARVVAPVRRRPALPTPPAPVLLGTLVRPAWNAAALLLPLILL